jgi:hypothetical protein
MAKICLVGSAPASVRLAPYTDPSWRIVGCSPGVYGIAPRVDEWFETHLWEPGQPWFSPEYVQWLTALPGRGVKLWVGGPTPIEGAQVFPFDAVLAKFDPQRWFCSSSLFWMMARAIELIEEEASAEQRSIDPRLDKIAFYGVDMAAGEEYEMQRAGIHFLTYRAAAMGIEVGAPPESDLFTPRFRYGADEWTHSYRKMRARRQELEARKAQADAAAREQEKLSFFLQGAIDDQKYNAETWADKRAHLGITPAVAAPQIVPLQVRDYGPRPGEIMYVDKLP